MFHFHRGLYADVRIEDVFETKIQITLNNYTGFVDGKEHIKMWRLNYLDQNVEKSFYSSKGAYLCWDYQRVGFRFFTQFALNDKTFEDSFDSAGVKFTDILPSPDKITDFYDEAVLFLKEAEELKKGKYPVVLSPEAAGVFAHESFGHKSEADFMLGDDMMKKEWAIGGTRELGTSAVSISKKLNIASSTASESAMRGRQIVEERGWKLLEEAKSENPRNVP